MESVDAHLVQRLWQPVARPGLIAPRPARAILDRHLGMTAGVPLAESLTRRAALAEGPAPSLPIVFAHPTPLPDPTTAERPANLPANGERPLLPVRGQVRPPASSAPPQLIQRRVDPSAPAPNPGDATAVGHSTPNLSPKEGASSLFRGQVRRESPDADPVLPQPPAAFPVADLLLPQPPFPSPPDPGAPSPDGPTPDRPAGAGDVTSVPGPVVRPVVVGRVVPLPRAGALPLASSGGGGDRPATRSLEFGSDDRPVVRPLPVVAERPGSPALPLAPNGSAADGHRPVGAVAPVAPDAGSLPVVLVAPPAPPGATPPPVARDAAARPVVVERARPRPSPVPGFDGRTPLAAAPPSRSTLPLAARAPAGTPMTGTPGTPATPGRPPLPSRPTYPGPVGTANGGTPTNAARPPRDRDRDQPAAAAKAPAAPEVDVGRIAATVHRRFLRQLAIEGERRGVR